MSPPVQWLKKGKAAHEELEKEDAKMKASGNNIRFWMQAGEERTITFLDGMLTDDGLLDIPMYYEHTVKSAGQWTQFVCVAEEEPCPICESGEKSQLVGALSIIDHTGYYSKKEEKQVENIRRLYIAPRTMIKQLQTLAAKRGGLQGLTFDVMRTDKRTARVGDLLDFQGKTDLKELKKTFGDTAEPFDYAEVLPHMPADELRKLGFGGAKFGGESGPSDDDGGSSDGNSLPWAKGNKSLEDKL